jgi:hypothetical protein
MVQPTNQVRCPNCGSPVQAHIEQLIDVGADPSAKARLLSGRLNLIQCPTCGFQGQATTPLVYHDPQKELLLTFVPVEINLPKDDQERLIGSMINQVIQRLPAEKRKGYLLQPQPVLTFQGLIDRILEADGVTKEDIEAQRKKLRLFEELLRTPQDQLPAFVAQHDEELDEIFFQLASLSLQSVADPRARAAAAQLLDLALSHSSLGRQLETQEREFRAAADSLRQAGEKLTHDHLLQLFIEAPNEDRVRALAQLARPGLDYLFFQKLTERIDAAQGEAQDRLRKLRQTLLEIIEQIDKAQQARAAQAAELLQSILQAQDMEQAVRSALPLIDELFLGILQANLRTAREAGEVEKAARLEQVDQHIRKIIRQALPPGLQLAQQIIEASADLGAAEKLLRENAERLDEEALAALQATCARLEEMGDAEGAERMRKLFRLALRLSMQAKMRPEGAAKAPPSGDGSPS